MLILIFSTTTATAATTATTTTITTTTTTTTATTAATTTATAATTTTTTPPTSFQSVPSTDSELRELEKEILSYLKDVKECTVRLMRPHMRDINVVLLSSTFDFHTDPSLLHAMLTSGDLVEERGILLEK